MTRSLLRSCVCSMVLAAGALCACDSAGGVRAATKSTIDTGAARDASTAAVAPDRASDAGEMSSPRADAGATSSTWPQSAPDNGAPAASWLIQSGESVFFIGNSFFGDTNDRLYDEVASLGQSLNPPFVIHTDGFIVAGVSPLSWFYRQPESQAAIQSGKYTMFVIEGAEREPVEDPEGFKQAVRDYHQAIVSSGGRMMLFMTWDWIWEQNTDFLAKLSQTYDEIGEELGVPVIPVGLIYDDSNKNPYGGEQSYWLTSQDLHQNKLGEVVNTYATFAMLTGIDPAGDRIPLIDDQGEVISNDLYSYLSQLTWARIAPRLAR